MQLLAQLVQLVLQDDGLLTQFALQAPTLSEAADHRAIIATADDGSNLRVTSVRLAALSHVDKRG